VIYLEKLNKILIKTESKIKRNIELISLQINRLKKLEDTIVISGSPRSGSTWLLEILETLPNYKSIFEPLHKSWFPNVKKIGLESRPYLAYNDNNPLIKDYFYKIFIGEYESISFKPSFQMSFNSLYKIFSANKLLVKFVRANRMLPWINNNFKLKQIFLIIRHPCATISSQIKTGIRGYYLPKEILLSKKIVLKEIKGISIIEDNLELIKKIKSIKTQEEILALIWSLDYYFPLIHFKPKAWKIVIYEKLLTDSKNQIKKIFDSIDYETPKRAYKIIKQPSRKTSDPSDFNFQNQLSKWKKDLSKNQVNNIIKVTNWFGLEFYNEEVEPDYSLLEK
jgi:hypothetical protein